MRHAGKARDTPLIVENDQVVSLFFDARVVPSAMLRRDPCALAPGYTRMMMGFQRRDALR
ncbi:hypothetical protein [Paraburkholderia pallida]|uniref:Uncharacterized protein n=1 Tax=Paraburkholderia pallida TaxID=2547399 RepID=A0A4P7D9U5_9BURK|nr:hypothetical protein [Paraburkholderia pallida]QBR04207.1 hypothetical protein E1956_44580 [Paraburkholderia pallida]